MSEEPEEQDPLEEAEEAVKKAAEEILAAEEKKAKAELLAPVRDGAYLDGQTFPPLVYAVDGVLAEGLTLIAGAPKVGKSWLALDIALAVASGGYALGKIPVPQRPILYLALEDGERRLQHRCRTLLGWGAPIPPGLQFLTRVQPGGILSTVKYWLEEYPFGVVILDTLAKVMPLPQFGESTYERDYRIGSELKLMSDDHPGSAIAVNHHDRKANSEDFVDSVSGTHGLAGAADSIIALQRQRHSIEGRLKVVGRDVAEGEYAVNFTQGSFWTLDGEDLEEAAKNAAPPINEKEQLVKGYVIAHPGQTQAEIAKGCKVHNEHVRRAHKHGHIAQEGNAYYPAEPAE